MSANDPAGRPIGGGVVPIAMVQAEPIHGGICSIRMAQAGAWARLNRSEARAYGVIIAHANAFTGEARPAVSTVAREAGLSQRTAKRALASLADKGLVAVSRGGGRGLANTYRVVAEPAEAGLATPGKGGQSSDTVSGKKGVEALTPFSEKGCHPAPERVSSGAQKGVKALTPQHIEHIEHQQQLTSDNGPGRPTARGGCAAAAAGVAQAAEPGPERAEVLAALTRAGVGSPTREQLAELPGVTPGLVREVAGRTTARGGGPGAVVQDVRAAVEARTVAAADEEAARARQAAERAEREAEREPARRQAAERETLLAELSPEELADYAGRVRAEASPFRRQAWAGADPASCCTLRVAIAAAVRRDRGGLLAGGGA